MRKKIFFICGSMNQTTQMHQISKHLSDYEQTFSPFYCHGFDEILRKLVERYREVLQRLGNAHEQEALIKRLDFLVAMLPKDAKVNRVRHALQGLIGGIAS